MSPIRLFVFIWPPWSIHFSFSKSLHDFQRKAINDPEPCTKTLYQPSENHFITIQSFCVISDFSAELKYVTLKCQNVNSAEVHNPFRRSGRSPRPRVPGAMSGHARLLIPITKKKLTYNPQ